MAIDFKPKPQVQPTLVNGHLEGGGQPSFKAFADNISKVPGQLKDIGANTGILPLVGSIGGGILGGIAGGVAASPTILGIPAGVIAGGAAGAGIGGAAGSVAQQALKGHGINAGEAAKTGLEYGALEAVGGPIASIAGKVLIKPAGEALAKIFIPTSAKEAGLLQTYKAGNTLAERVKNLLSTGETGGPTTAASTAFDKGLMGTESMIGVQAKRASGELWNGLISPALKQSSAKVDMPKFFDALQEQIVAKNPELSRQKSLLEALDALKEDYKGVTQISLEDLQKFKEGWAKFIPDKAYRGKPIAGAFKDVQNMAAGNARGVIYDALGPNVKQAYFDYGNLQALQELGQTAMTGGKLKGGAGSFISGLYEMATVPIGTIGGQTLYKVGQGVEMLGAPGARTVRDIIGASAGIGSPSDQAYMSQSATTLPNSTPPIKFRPK